MKRSRTACIAVEPLCHRTKQRAGGGGEGEGEVQTCEVHNSEVRDTRPPLSSKVSGGLEHSGHACVVEMRELPGEVELREEEALVAVLPGVAWASLQGSTSASTTSVGAVHFVFLFFP